MKTVGKQTILFLAFLFAGLLPQGLLAQKPMTFQAMQQTLKAKRAMRPAAPKQMAPVSRAGAGETILYGSFIDSYVNDYYVGAGIYAYNAYDAATPTLVKEGVRVYGGGTYGGGLYYAQNFTENSNGTLVLPVALNIYDPAADWALQKTYYAVWYVNIASDLTYDPTQKKLYGVFWNEDYNSVNQFGYIELDSPQQYYFNAVILGEMPERTVALAATPDGTMYAFGVSGNLYTVDKANGATTLVGNTGVAKVSPWYQSACYDEVSGKLFWHTLYGASYDYGTYEVDPATARATLVGDFGHNGTYTQDQITGLTTLRDPQVATYAPLPVSNLTAAFAGSSLTGTVRFDLPTQDANGGALSGDLTYTVYLDGTQAATGTAAAGTTANAAVTIDAVGEHTITVTCATAGVTSCATTATGWVGPDTPKAPVSVSARVTGTENGQSLIFVGWAAPTEGVHGGALDAASLTYTVMRMPEGVKVYEGSAQSFTDRVSNDIKQTFHYEVTAHSGDLSSTAASTAELTVGEANGVPYFDDFADDRDRSDYAVVDANNDGSTWALGNGYIYYKYNAKNPGDDYMVLPGLKLKAGNLYHFDFSTRNTSLVERVAAYVGVSPDIDALHTELVPPTDITYEPRVHNLRGDFIPTEDGTYYFAIKCCSEADMSTLYVDNVSVTMTAASAPAAPTDFVLTAGDKGALSANLSFQAPTQSVAGTTLTAIDACVVERDGTVVGRIESVTPGQTVTFTDTEGLTADTHTYKVYAVAAGEEGDVATASTYIGLDAPGPVRNLRACEDLNEPGTVVLTWDAPEVGQHGGYVNPEGLVYFVSYGYSGSEVSTYDKTYRYKIDISAGQAYEAFSVYADNSAGSGRYVWQTVVAIAGPAVEAPLVESFPGVTMNSGPWLPEMVIGEIGEARWTPGDGSYLESGTQDGDGGVIAFSTTKVGKASRIISPKVSLGTLSQPQLSFWLYQTGHTDELKVEISPDYGDYELIKTIRMNEDTKGWHRYTVDLGAWRTAGFVRVAFQGVSVETKDWITSLDNIAFSESLEYDLQVNELTAPKKIKVGETGTFTVKVRNAGNKDLAAADYTIELYKNDKLAGTFDGQALPIGATKTFTLTDEPTIDDSEISVYRAEVKCSKDEKAANNSSNNVSVEILLPQYPRVTTLQGAWTGKDIALTWEEPDFADMPAQSTTERFETYPSFAISGYGDWKTVDRDGAQTIRITLDATFGPLEYEHAGEPMAFQVFSAMDAGIPFSSWDAHSGEKMLVAFKCASPDQGTTEIDNDDWLISPELNGAAQTISFYAKTGMGAPYVPEEFQVLYSTTTPTVDAFTQVGETYAISNVKGWEEFKVSLPEGAKYFAIRCVSKQKFALMLDDITYIPVGAVAEDLSLMGYNVYRDGQKVNSEPWPESVWTDASTQLNETHTYRVTAVYDKGESLYSNEVSVLNTAVESISAEQASITTLPGAIRVNGAKGHTVAIYAMDGRCLFHAVAGEQLQVAAPCGFYVVKVSGATGVTVRVP